jgi:hypothetical protein
MFIAGVREKNLSQLGLLCANSETRTQGTVAICETEGWRAGGGGGHKGLLVVASLADLPVETVECTRKKTLRHESVATILG